MRKVILLLMMVTLISGILPVFAAPMDEEGVVLIQGTSFLGNSYNDNISFMPEIGNTANIYVKNNGSDNIKVIITFGSNMENTIEEYITRNEDKVFTLTDLNGVTAKNIKIVPVNNIGQKIDIFIRARQFNIDKEKSYSKEEYDSILNGTYTNK